MYNVLEEPEYMYGLRETDLRKLIRDVTSGMSYLREKVIFPRYLSNSLTSDYYLGYNSSRYKAREYFTLGQVR